MLNESESSQPKSLSRAQPWLAHQSQHTGSPVRALVIRLSRSRGVWSQRRRQCRVRSGQVTRDNLGRSGLSAETDRRQADRSDGEAADRAVVRSQRTAGDHGSGQRVTAADQGVTAADSGSLQRTRGARQRTRGSRQRTAGHCSGPGGHGSGQRVTAADQGGTAADHSTLLEADGAARMTHCAYTQLT